MSSTLKKIILAVGIIALILFMGLIGFAWYMGAFSSVDITTAEKGPYHFIYMEHLGPYYEVVNKINEVENYLKKHNIEYKNAAGIYFDDPAKVKEEDLKSYAGFIVNDSLAVEKPFHYTKINRRQVVVAKIEAFPMIAPFKVYPAFHEWLENNKNIEIVAPPLELYFPEHIVEVHFAFQKKM